MDYDDFQILISVLTRIAQGIEDHVRFTKATTKGILSWCNECGHTWEGWLQDDAYYHKDGEVYCPRCRKYTYTQFISKEHNKAELKRGKQTEKELAEKKGINHE